MFSFDDPRGVPSRSDSGNGGYQSIAQSDLAKPAERFGSKAVCRIT
jgi:hypothetical protein